MVVEQRSLLLFHLSLSLICITLCLQYNIISVLLFLFIKDSILLLQLIKPNSLNSTFLEDNVSNNLPVVFKEWIQEVATPTTPRNLDLSFQGQKEEFETVEKMQSKFSIDPSSKVALFTAKLKLKVKEKKGFDEQVENFFQQHSIDSWSFDVFELDNQFPNNSLSALSIYLFSTKYNFLNKFNISNATYLQVVQQVENAMRLHSNPYHNHIHVADVMQTLHVLLQHCQQQLNHLDCFAALLAALFHDYEHPGNNNLFEMNTDSDKAQRFNYQSILENFHLQLSLPLLSKLLHNSNLSREQHNYIKHTLITMILSTDISRHMQSVKTYTQTFVQQRKLETSMLLCFLLQCADVSNSTKLLSISLKWTDRVLNEFYRQGDREMELKLPISPLCDRNRLNNREASQIGFIDFVCRPLYSLLIQVEPSLQHVLDSMNKNYEYWKTQL